MLALTTEELLAWTNHTVTSLFEMMEEHPAALSLPCDIRESETVADLLQHIVAVELRYAERLNGLTETAYEDLRKDSPDALLATHAGAINLLMPLLKQDAGWWEETIDFKTRRGGQLTASRRTILVHLLMHTIRHSAQLATLLRQHGIAAGWPMDYLFMHAIPQPAPAS